MLLQISYEEFFTNFFGFYEQRLLMSSQFFEELYNYTVALYNQTTPTKLVIYSGTKTNIFVILSSLLTKKQIRDLGSKKVAPLSSSIIVEYWSNQKSLSEKDRYYVTIRYGEEKLQLLQCKSKKKCSMREFLLILKTRIVKDLKKICSHKFSP